MAVNENTSSEIGVRGPGGVMPMGIACPRCGRHALVQEKDGRVRCDGPDCRYVRGEGSSKKAKAEDKTLADRLDQEHVHPAVKEALR
jgi:uncharacterized Zn finger protein (UPF0148 family)